MSLKMITREYMMTDSLSVICQRLTPEERQQVGARLEFYTAEFTRIAAEHDNPLDIACTIHEVVDREIVAHQRRHPSITEQVSCRQGCSYCCEMGVGIIPEEAALLIAYAREEALPFDLERVQRQAPATAKTWKDLAPYDRRCTFLADDGTCRVYEYRPFACRKYFVISPPIECKENTHAMRFVAPLAEIIATAAQTVFGMVTMPDGLRVALNRPKKDDELQTDTP